jgi:ubiquitin conjugation factor E4 B
MQEIMNDPVLLPTSNVIVDRVTINKHLLIDSTDPFNRKKLTKEMLIP